ncbi:hypothetical protein Pcinc_018739 [Petrolisthes cinctipes]|uniref:Nocturnin n=1 Tax=Petrolisthes cinctipes TaxID=88211 RepID=A0AAE1KLA8_PETCI|nr:hypothetical protein Pcinc_018739 [Petrolisthes cinctipes]
MNTGNHTPRMGSFTSKPQQVSEECEDDLLVFPDGMVGRDDLLHWVQEPLVDLPPLLPHTYHYPTPSTPPSPSPSSHNNITLPTTTTTTTPHPPPDNSFRVMQWNILAQALGTNTDNFVRCPPEALDWNTRKFRIVEEMLTYLPQFICCQEVDHYNFLERVMERLGYCGVFMPKPDSPCLYLPNNNGPDGCAIFWDDTRFKLLTTQTRVVEVWHVQSNQVVILLVLEERSTGQQLVLLTTHLKARQGALLASLRNEQGKDLLAFVEQHCKGRPVIVCGDFNAEPSEPVYTTMTEASTGLHSAYSFLNDGREPTYSTWKVRGEVDCCQNLDYIFYTPDKLTVEGGFDVPSEEDLGPNRAPSLSYPSDHFALICDFTFKPQLDVEECSSASTSHL